MFTLGRNTGSRYASEHMHYTYVCIDIVVVPPRNMDEKQYANIMTAIAMNANDREYNRLEYLMRELLEIALEEAEE